HRLCCRSGQHGRLVQGPHSVSGYASVQAHEAADHGNGLGEIRWTNANLQASEHESRGIETPPWPGLYEVLHSSIIRPELPGNQDPQRNVAASRGVHETSSTRRGSRVL